MLIALNCGSLVLALPPPVTTRSCSAPDDLHGAEAPQAVGDDGGRRRDRARGKHRHLLVRERLLTQAHELRLAVRRRLHRGDERHLVLRAAPGLAARALAAQVGVVDLHPAVELADRPHARA